MPRAKKVVENVPEPDITDQVFEEVNEEEEQKKRYYNYIEVARVDLERVVDSAAGSFHAMSNTVLVDTAMNYKERPFNYIPNTAEALMFEMNKRNLRKEVSAFNELLKTIDWYNKPWIRF